MLPTFIIGGAPRSGTTYLCHVLERHPDVYLAKPYIPEPKVFVGPNKDPGTCRALYTKLFETAGGKRARGEKTTHYLQSAAICALIRDTVPSARMLFIVREPVARAYSNYLRSRKNGFETLGFEQAVELEGKRPSPLPPEKAYARPFDYLIRGDYGTFAECYYAAFGRTSVGFFLYENLISRPAPVLHDIQRFIGVEPLPLEREAVGPVNAGHGDGAPIDPSTEARLRARMRPKVKHFERVSGLDLKAWGYD